MYVFMETERRRKIISSFYKIYIWPDIMTRYPVFCKVKSLISGKMSIRWHSINDCTLRAFESTVQFFILNLFFVQRTLNRPEISIRKLFKSLPSFYHKVRGVLYNVYIAQNMIFLPLSFKKKWYLFSKYSEISPWFWYSRFFLINHHIFPPNT